MLTIPANVSFYTRGIAVLEASAAADAGGGNARKQLPWRNHLLSCPISGI
jgi:hypothetical protein